MRRPMLIRVLGAGVAGLTAAYECARRGATVEIIDRLGAPAQGCSKYAGGMLAPWCELESAEPLVETLGLESMQFWQNHFTDVPRQGSLVVAQPRDLPDLKRFSRRTHGFDWIDAAKIAELEPDLAGRFDSALYFEQESHLNPRLILAELAQRLAQDFQVTFHFNTDAAEIENTADYTIDCRGLAARDELPDLRPVKGEMLLLRSSEVKLSRPVRMLHPRIPVYIVPRADAIFMVGATMVENNERGRVTARGIGELLNAAYALHPAFGEAEIVELGADLRPAFADHLPRLRKRGTTLYINGLYRHGFLLAPALAARAAAVIFEGKVFPEVMDEA